VQAVAAGQILFTYLHLAPDPEQARALIASGPVHRLRDGDVTARRIAVAGADVEVAGRMAVRPVRSGWKSRKAARAFCWAASRAWRRGGSSSWAAVLSARIPR
jgi:alanine dehydrogenase